jgi:large subunit ribosomal protein L22
MESRAIARYVRISPRKVRLVADLVRGRKADDALGILDLSHKRAAAILAKTLRSAIANAEDTQHVDVDRLYVKRTFVDEGPTWGRWRPRAQGRATQVLKRTSHITVVVDERGGSR